MCWTIQKMSEDAKVIQDDFMTHYKLYKYVHVPLPNLTQLDTV
ncbi:hypothetical protein GCM10008027_45760 [Pseudoalteromonas gelatinilytica]|uniref:Uncharacterized protein n=1 Tax=Pseudoalteromonas gelatinilytica TaxID=1703256 RepID=A0ABQ1UCK6_9GAMM|nr:hypothetical protein GCM10008027_45760 [Pseudoalteromonas profundi]